MHYYSFCVALIYVSGSLGDFAHVVSQVQPLLRKEVSIGATSRQFPNAYSGGISSSDSERPRADRRSSSSLNQAGISPAGSVLEREQEPASEICADTPSFRDVQGNDCNYFQLVGCTAHDFKIVDVLEHCKASCGRCEKLPFVLPSNLQVPVASESLQQPSRDLSGVPTGQQACEGNGLGESECHSVGCCFFDDSTEECRSSVGITKPCFDRVWDFVDGGVGRECRGDQSTDYQTSYFELFTMGLPSLEVCKSKCAMATACKGIRYEQGYCEVWMRPIMSTVKTFGSLCLAYRPPAEWLRISGQSVKQSSTHGAAHPGRAIDDNSNMLFSQGSCTQTESEASPWWSLDLGETYAVESLRIANRGDCCGDDLNPFSVFVDGQPCAFNISVQENTAGQIVCQGVGQQLKIQVQKRAPTSLTLCEVEVAAKATPYFTPPNSLFYMPPQRQWLSRAGTLHFLRFGVLASQDAHLALYAGSPTLNPVNRAVDAPDFFYDICLGCGEHHTDCSLSRGLNQHREVLASSETPILSPVELRDFWISVDAALGIVALGRGRVVGDKEFFRYQDSATMVPLTFSVMTGAESTGEWEFGHEKTEARPHKGSSANNGSAGIPLLSADVRLGNSLNASETSSVIRVSGAGCDGVRGLYTFSQEDGRWRSSGNDTAELFAYIRGGNHLAGDDKFCSASDHIWWMLLHDVSKHALASTTGASLARHAAPDHTYLVASNVLAADTNDVACYYACSSPRAASHNPPITGWIGYNECADKALPLLELNPSGARHPSGPLDVHK